MFRLLQRIWRPQPRTVSFGRTDTGRVRSQNEDSFSILEKRSLYLVADGMGGHNAGEVASRVAIERLIDYFSPSMVKELGGRQEAIRQHLIRAFHEVNEHVMTMAAAEQEHQGMGCTLVAGLLDRRTLHVCHVGDVRCYVANRDRLRQITTDHSYAAFLAQNQGGTVDPGLAGVMRNVVTRAVGFPFPEEPEYHRVSLQKGDRVLLCSDGLWSMIDDETIQRVLRQAATPERACEDFMRLANDAGGRDNITAVVIFQQ